jgi:hypothetical protein
MDAAGRGFDINAAMLAIAGFQSRAVKIDPDALPSVTIGQ